MVDCGEFRRKKISNYSYRVNSKTNLLFKNVRVLFILQFILNKITGQPLGGSKVHSVLKTSRMNNIARYQKCIDSACHFLLKTAPIIFLSMSWSKASEVQLTL